MYNSDFTIKTIISTELLESFFHSSIKTLTNSFLRDTENDLTY